MLVANKPGVLVRIALVFARRGFNIDSLVVSAGFNPRFSRMTITAQGAPEILRPVIHQLNKLIDVIHAFEHTGKDSVHTELALFKVKYTPTTKAILTKLIKGYRTRILDDSEKTMILEQAGPTEDLNILESKLKKYGMVEMVRTGKVVMVKGHEAT